MKIDSAYYSKRKDIIILQFPIEAYELDEIHKIMTNIQSVFPENTIICLPANISISILREENPFL